MLIFTNKLVLEDLYRSCKSLVSFLILSGMYLFQKCVYNGFHCVQRSRTLILVRRRWENECWEPFVKQIPSGCDCMWPKSVLGDITKHY